MTSDLHDVTPTPITLSLQELEPVLLGRTATSSSKGDDVVTPRARMFAPGGQAQASGKKAKASSTQAVFGTLSFFRSKPGVPGIATSKAHPKVPSSPAQSTAPPAGGNEDEVVESTGGG